MNTQTKSTTTTKKNHNDSKLHKSLQVRQPLYLHFHQQNGGKSPFCAVAASPHERHGLDSGSLPTGKN